MPHQPTPTCDACDRSDSDTRERTRARARLWTCACVDVRYAQAGHRLSPEHIHKRRWHWRGVASRGRVEAESIKTTFDRNGNGMENVTSRQNIAEPTHCNCDDRVRFSTLVSSALSEAESVVLICESNERSSWIALYFRSARDGRTRTDDRSRSVGRWR